MSCLAQPMIQTNDSQINSDWFTNDFKFFIKKNCDQIHSTEGFSWTTNTIWTDAES